MNESFVVKKSITVNADPVHVWNALTTPEMTKKYFFGCAVNSDWKKGSPISFKRNLLCIHFELNGKIIEAEPLKRLQYSLKSRGSKSSDASQSLVTDELIFQNGKTTLTITDDGGQGPDAEKRYKKSVKGWNKVLSGLKRTVEQSTL